jgi:hypothetical protein
MNQIVCLLVKLIPTIKFKIIKDIDQSYYKFPVKKI